MTTVQSFLLITEAQKIAVVTRLFMFSPVQGLARYFSPVFGGVATKKFSRI